MTEPPPGHSASPAEAATAVVPPLPARERWRTYLFCLFGWLFDFYDLILFAYLAKEIGKEWNWGAEAHHNKGLLVGITLGASGIGGIIFGGLADRFGRRRVMAWTILVYSLSTGLCGLATGLVSLAIFRAMTGLGVGGEWATGHALMAEVFPKEKRGLASALLQAGEPVGVALAVLTGLELAPALDSPTVSGWRVVFFLSAAPALLAVFLRRFVKESPLWLAARARGGEPPVLERYRILFRDHWRPALKGYVLGLTKLGTYWITYVWLPEYFEDLWTHRGAGGVGSGQSFESFRLTFILLAQGGQLAGMLLFGPLADRIGRRPAFTIYSVLTAAGLFALAGFGQEMLARPEWFWPAMGAVGLGSGCTAGFGALLAELFPTSIRNTAMGTVYNVARGSQLFTQLIMAGIAVRWGIPAGLYLAMAFALVTATWVWTLPETKGTALRSV